MSKPQPIDPRRRRARCARCSTTSRKTRNVPDVNNFWKHLANDPALLARTWESVKAVMAPGALDPLTKEMIYLAVSVTNNGCAYCIASHSAGARKAGMSEAMFGELMAVVVGEPDQPARQRLSRPRRCGLGVRLRYPFTRAAHALRQRHRRRPVEQRADAAGVQLERVE